MKRTVGVLIVCMSCVGLVRLQPRNAQSLRDANGGAPTGTSTPHPDAGAASAPPEETGPAWALACRPDAGRLMALAVDKRCRVDEECIVFRPRTAPTVLGCCLAVRKDVLEMPEFDEELHSVREKCGYVSLACRAYSCERSVCYRGACHLVSADGGPDLDR